MKEREMQEVAEFIERVVKDGEETKEIKLEVSEFVSEFQKIKYCYE